MTSYRDIPIEPSTYGERLYRLGGELVDAGVTPERVMFDCDEVLWDWSMSLSQLAQGSLQRVPGHREHVLVKPGIFEMLWGMRHAAQRQGAADPRIRLWTHGYPWRLWRIAQGIPGLAALVGLESSATPSDWDAHSTVFSRVDYARVVESLLCHDRVRDKVLSGIERDEARALLSRHLSETPLDSTLKIPELAPVVGKSGFGGVHFLVDDSGRNIKRFIATGRRGVRVRSLARPRLWGRVPNTVWRGAKEATWRMSNGVAEAVAAALLELSTEAAPSSRSVGSEDRPPADHALNTFAIDVPHKRVRAEWIAPMRRLKKTFRAS